MSDEPKSAAISERRDLADAIVCALILVLFCAVLLTAPVWGEWLDGKADQWERATADRHAEVYERMAR